MARSTERTPLLRDSNGSTGQDVPEKSRSLFSPANRILFAGFLVSLTLSITQVPIIYVFRVMTCDAYYETHPPFEGPQSRRCSRPEIDSATATQVSILGMSTSLCGIINLILCGAFIKRFGTKWGFISQTGVLAIRVSCQVLSVAVGGRAGIIWMQATQLIGIIGGPRGYMLVLNTAVSEAVPRREHTGVFGRLEGAQWTGRAIGYLLGGVLGDAFGIQSPFISAVGCFVVGTLYGAVSWPNSSMGQDESGAKAKSAPSGFLAPLKVLMPQRFQLESGKIVKHWGLVFLALGIFFGVFATGYAPILIQMFATSRFEFGTTENGVLMAGNCLIRGIFLMFIFPKIIDAGRRWFAATHQHSYHPDAPGSDAEEEDPLHLETEEIEPVPGLMNSEEPTKPPHVPTDDEDDLDSTFDLFFLRWSLVVDGIVTSMGAWATQGWHMYLAAFLLPFASGSAPAAKGVITEMCPPYLRQDALSAITLVESAAVLGTQGFFGFIYASLSAIDKAQLTFFCNGGLAVIAVGILLLARYPPYNSRRIEPDEFDDAAASSDAQPANGSTPTNGSAHAR